MSVELTGKSRVTLSLRWLPNDQVRAKDDPDAATITFKHQHIDTNPTDVLIHAFKKYTNSSLRMNAMRFWLRHAQPFTPRLCPALFIHCGVQMVEVKSGP